MTKDDRDSETVRHVEWMARSSAYDTVRLAMPAPDLSELLDWSGHAIETAMHAYWPRGWNDAAEWGSTLTEPILAAAYAGEFMTVYRDETE